MPTLTIKLKTPDDALIADTWKLYYAFIGRYYQRPIDSEAGFSMMAAYKDYSAWAWSIPLTTDEWQEFDKLRCKTLDAIFDIRTTNV